MISLYTPPPGYYDLPFMWVYDANSLTNGNNYPNQFVYILGGYGRFILRRIVGMDLVFSTAAAAQQIQVKDASGNYIQSSPVVLGGLPGDWPIAPEIEYPETGKIGFDLFDIQKFSPGSQGSIINYAYLGFHGVRRLPGVSPLVAAGNFKPKTFTYTQNVTVTQPAFGTGGGQTPPLAVYQKVNDYDFELHQILIWDTTHQNDLFDLLLLLYDSNKNITSNIPAPLDFFNGLPVTGIPPQGFSDYGNGALVPPLFYPVNSQIRLDIFSRSTLANVPRNLAIQLVGRQRIPCA